MNKKTDEELVDGISLSLILIFDILQALIDLHPEVWERVQYNSNTLKLLEKFKLKITDLDNCN